MKVLKRGYGRSTYDVPIRFQCPNCKSILQAEVEEFGEKKFLATKPYYDIMCIACSKVIPVEAKIVEEPLTNNIIM